MESLWLTSEDGWLELCCCDNLSMWSKQSMLETSIISVIVSSDHGYRQSSSSRIEQLRIFWPKSVVACFWVCSTEDFSCSCCMTKAEEGAYSVTLLYNLTTFIKHLHGLAHVQRDKDKCILGLVLPGAQLCITQRLTQCKTLRRPTVIVLSK